MKQEPTHGVQRWDGGEAAARLNLRLCPIRQMQVQLMYNVFVFWQCKAKAKNKHVRRPFVELQITWGDHLSLGTCAPGVAAILGLAGTRTNQSLTPEALRTLIHLVKDAEARRCTGLLVAMCDSRHAVVHLLVCSSPHLLQHVWVLPWLATAQPPFPRVSPWYLRSQLASGARRHVGNSVRYWLNAV